MKKINFLMLLLLVPAMAVAAFSPELAEEKAFRGGTISAPPLT